MDKKTRTHSICEKKPYIAVILSIIIPSILASIQRIKAEKAIKSKIESLFSK